MSKVDRNPNLDDFLQNRQIKFDLANTLWSNNGDGKSINDLSLSIVEIESSSDEILSETLDFLQYLKNKQAQTKSL